PRKSPHAGRRLQDSGGHRGVGRQPPEDGEDEQGRGGRRGRRQALHRDQRGQGHRRRLRRLSRPNTRILPMASTIRVRAIASGDTTQVQSLISHPMDSGFVKDSKGQLIPPHHIDVVEFEHAGKVVFTCLWGPAVSKDPYVKFSFKGGKKGDDLKVSWVDNKGKSDSLVAKIQ